MLKALLIDDEITSLRSLELLLGNNCEDILVQGKVKSAGEARDWLRHHHADVLFLDINMPEEDGFQFLDSLGFHNFKVVFITACEQYALKAIKAGALDYILKPVKINELQIAVKRVRNSYKGFTFMQNQPLQGHVSGSEVNKVPIIRKIAVPQLGGIRFIDIEEIISLEANGNYTVIHLKDMLNLVISKTLKDFEELLEEDHFVRIHKSYMVNLNYIREYSTADGGVLKMIDGSQWSISRGHLDIFLGKMKTATAMFGKRR